MQRARREREFDVKLLRQVDELQQQRLAFLEFGGSVGDDKVEDDEDVEAAFAKVVEADADGRLISRRVLLDQLLEAPRDTFSRSAACRR